MDTIADYNAWKARQQQNGVGAAQVVIGSVNENPDEIAGDLNLASEFGKVTGSPVPPVPMVKEYRNVFQEAIEREKSKTILSKSPVLTEWLRNPDNAAIARDDLENLSWFEGFARGSANTLKRSGQRLGQAGNTYMLNQAAGRAQDRRMSFGQILESEQDVVSTAKGDVRLFPNLGDFLSASGRWIDAKYADLIGADDEGAAQEYAAALQGNIDRLRATPKSQIATEAEQAMFKEGATVGQVLQNVGGAIASNPLGVLSWALETAGESAPQLAAMVGVAAATRNPAAGVATLGAGSYATERYVSVADFLAEKGIDLGNANDVGRVLSEPELLKEANDRGVIRGLVIGAFDMASAGLAGRVLAGNPLVEAAAQGLQQAISGSLGEYSARLAAGQEIDWNEIIAEGLAEVATAPIDMGVAGRRLVGDRRRARDAEGTVAQITEIGAQAQASKLRARMPDKFRQLVEAATANGPVENVFVPADQFVQYFQGIDVDPYALVDELDGVTRDDLDAALAGGGDLQIPTATYAAKIAGTDADPFFMENMRFDPDEFTAAEAAAFNERAQDALQEAWEIAESVRVEREQLSAVEDQIYDSMVSRLRTSGRSTDVATTEALLYPAFYRVMAERSGMTTEEFLGRYPLPEIQGDIPQGMQFRDVDELTRTLSEARNRRATGLDKRGPSLLEFISDYGGINDIGGELRSRNAETVKRGKGKKTLKLARGGVVAGARDLLGATGGKKFGVDDVALAAIEAGYLANEPEAIEFRAAMEEGREVPDITRALWNAIDRELRGEAQYVSYPQADAAAEEAARLDEIEAYLSSLGVSLEDDDAKIRQAIEGAKAYAQSGSLGPRGLIQFSAGGVGKGETIVRLFQNADLSTFLHESGHYFLSVLQDMAGRGGGGGFAPDRNGLRNEIGTGSALDFSVEAEAINKKLRDDTATDADKEIGRVLEALVTRNMNEQEEALISIALAHGRKDLARALINLSVSMESLETRLLAEREADEEYKAENSAGYQRAVDIRRTALERQKAITASMLAAYNAGEHGGNPFASDFEAVKSWWRENAAAVARDAMRVMPDVTVTADDVIAAIDSGTTGDLMRDGAIDVGMQEQWARGFEAYLMEGKAPSADLRSAFEKFRSWLISIYKRLAGLNVTISDDIRGVFDRMIATDEEIEKAQVETGGNHPLFANAEEMGLTPEEYAGFMKLRAQAEDEAKARLLRETMEPVKRAQEKWFKDERAKVREEVEREVNAFRYFRAIEWMGNRRWFGDDQPEDMPDIRLSKSILVDRYGKGVLDTLPRGKQTVYAVEGGIDPDDAAGWFGFDSGDEMIRAMEKAPKRTEAIEAETDRVMRERHGDALNDGSIEASALAAVHTDKRGQWIAAELSAVIDIAGVGVKVTAKEQRHAARQTLSRMRVKDATSAGRFLAAERKAAEEAARLGAMLAREGVWMQSARRRIASKARAAVRGDGTVEAVAPQIERANASTGNYNETVARLIEVKRRQLLNHMLYSEAIKVADEVEKAERLVAKLEKSTRKIRSERKRFGGASLAGDYIDAIEAIIYGYEFRRVSNAKIDRRAALRAYVQRMTEEGRANELAIPQAVLDDANVINYRMLTVEHLRGVVDSLKNIEHVARLKGKLLVNKRQRDFAELVDGLVEQIETNVGSRDFDWAGAGREGDDSITGKAREAVNGYISTFQSATTILRQIDGRQDLGTAYETLKTDMDEAAFSEREMRKAATDDILKLYAVYTPDEQRQMAVRLVVPELGGKSFSKWNLIAMALNMGNDGNLARLTNEKAQMHLTPAQVEAVKGLLDKRDWDFVQSVWDYIGSYRPKIAERDRRIRGIEASWVDAAPVETPVGTYRGGYYPIKYEGRLGGARFVTGSDDEILNSMMSGGYSSAATKDGHLKARGQHVTQSLTLDVGVIAQHTNEVIHDLAFSEAVVNTFRLLTNTAVDLAFKKAGLADQHAMLKLWVQDAATGQVSAGSKMARSVNLLRSGFTYSKLALNLKTILLQPLGLMQSGVVVGKRNLANQILRYMQNPVAMTNDVLGRSRMMWERRQTFNKDLMDAATKKNIASPATSKLRAAFDDYVIPFGMAGITYSQFYIVDVPTWAAAYTKGLKQFGGDETKAAQYADMTVQRSQGSGIWSDRSGIERGTLSSSMRQNPFVTLLTTLGSYFFTKMNIIIEKTQGVTAEPFSIGRSASYALDMAILLAGEAAVIALLSEIGDDDEDDDDTMIGTIASEAFRTFLAGLPVVRDAVGLYDGYGGGTYSSIINAPVKVLQQATQGEVDRAAVKSAVDLTGMLFRLPSSQANRIIDAGWRDLEGDDVSPLEYLLGRSRK